MSRLLARVDGRRENRSGGLLEEGERMRRGIDRRWFSWLTWGAVHLARRKMDPDDLRRRAKRIEYTAQLGRHGLRFTESLRDRLRRRWLKRHD